RRRAPWDREPPGRRAAAGGGARGRAGRRAGGRGVRPGARARRGRPKRVGMTSTAILAANRVNAARSTRPRTRAGKAAAARNALRHGLSLPVLADTALAAEAAALARRIAGEGAGEPRRSAAHRRGA